MTFDPATNNPIGHRYAQFDHEGRLIIPADMYSTLGAKPGAWVIIETNANRIKQRHSDLQGLLVGPGGNPMPITTREIIL